MARKSVDPLRKKILALLKARDQGKASYAEADRLLGELVAELPVGQVVELGGGRTAVLVDQFEGKTKVWKPCGVSRFDLKAKE